MDLAFATRAAGLAFRGKPVAVLASGPSMSPAVAADVRASGVASIVVNSTFRLAPWASMLVAADAEWWAATPDAAAFAGVKVCAQEGAPPGTIQIPNPWIAVRVSPGRVVTIRKSGLTAIRLAVQLGAASVHLAGFDPAGGHWHDDHPGPLRAQAPEGEDVARAALEHVVEWARSLGVQVERWGATVCT